MVPADIVYAANFLPRPVSRRCECLVFVELCFSERMFIYSRWRKCRQIISRMEPDSEVLYVVVAQRDTDRAGQRFVQGANKCVDGKNTQCEKYQKQSI